MKSFTPIPVLDKTKLTGGYDINLEWFEDKPETLHSELKKYALELIKSKQKLPVEVMKIYRK